MSLSFPGQNIYNRARKKPDSNGAAEAPGRIINITVGHRSLISVLM
jgi:hypothetical protein